ncbi:unnamed protein product [Darwinula stevensoni]|uniref:Cyclin-like domain-containing protein n=1 Tax=Darwinula stevensoni TaxID=69355 RepID=A0A7R8X2N1_9CRUS|nr:unnamed protein product [Darwinula stevensoni]CAG0884119.1 unnamed protein product [Darwinula stevensoni]
MSLAYKSVKDHFWSVKFIFECGRKLELKSHTICKAAAMYHRFFKEAHLRDYDPYVIAAACLFISGKSEDDRAQIRDVINVTRDTLEPGCDLLNLGEEYFSYRETITNAELLVLRMLKFDMTYHLPHRYLLHYLLSLELWAKTPEWKKDMPFERSCWAFLHDFHFSPAIVTYKPQLIAISIIFYALQCYGLQIPTEDVQWYEALHPEATVTQLFTIMDSLLEVYDNDKELSQDVQSSLQAKVPGF